MIGISPMPGGGDVAIERSSAVLGLFCRLSVARNARSSNPIDVIRAASRLQREIREKHSR
ncbi:MAG TPA: hypothetical protein VHE32_01130 [Rhodanobacteraceae bacterium]|nr:hypothetical protein [Rhodanobacteraceae bacterium]